MNIKKCTLKAVCAGLLCTTLLSSLLATSATDVLISESPMDESGDGGSDWMADEGSFEEIEVTYKQSSSYNVIIPKTIALDTSKQAAYSVKVTGDIDANERVHVVPIDGISSSESIDFYMKDQTPDSKKAEVVATVVQSKFYWNSEEVANGYEETNNSISAPDLTAGTWKGTFQVAINLETEKAHEHNYVDGKCDCGAIDPNHTHNYEDGKCTICGEKDSYTVAPAEAYSKWNYTLDNTNNIITLNYWNGTTSDTDVVVYANYVINGKTYKTQLASNSASATSDTKYMFCGWKNPCCRYIKTIEFSKDIDTSNVTNMSYMFYYCKALTDLDISCFDTSKVTNMEQMFRSCESLTNLDVSSLDTSNVTNMNWMFSYCESLTSLDVSNLNTGNVKNMSSMFAFCHSLTSLDLSNFDTRNVTDISYMFNECHSLTNLDLSSFDTSKVTKMSSMFQLCSALTELDLCSFDTGNVKEMNNMFFNTSNLTTIYVTEGKWSMSNATVATLNSMFNGCGTSEVTYK